MTNESETLDQLLDTDAAKQHNEEVRQNLMRQKALFSRVFNSEDGRGVLKALEEFCYVNKSPAHPTNPYATYLALGRQEVYLALNEILLNDKGVE